MRKIILTIIIFLIFTISIILIYQKKDNEILDSTKDNKNNMLSIMVERDAGTGNYVAASSFPSNGYYLNKKLSKCVNGSKLSFSDGNLYVKGNRSDRCYAYFDKYDFTKSCLSGHEKSFACDLIKNKNETLYFHDGSFKDQEGNITDANDKSYRYAGASNIVNNFVCLDGGVTTGGLCANDDADLYRIIGLFLNENNKYEIKLIKYDYATTTELGTDGSFTGTYENNPGFYIGNANNLANIGGYSWVRNSDVVLNEWFWEYSELRKTNLNEFYLNYLQTNKHIDDKMITDHIWKLNGCDSNGVIPRDMYNSEMGNGKYVSSGTTYPSTIKEITNKIGLMYISDYGFTVPPEDSNNWTNDLKNYYEFGNKNWLRMGLYDWSISRMISRPEVTFFINDSGGVYVAEVFGGVDDNKNQGFNVRPCFYLSEDTQLLNGLGTKENPYRLKTLII